MTGQYFILGFLVIIFWGIYGILTKLSILRIGIQSLIWSTLSTTILLLLYFFFSPQFRPISLSKSGIIFGLFAGLISTIGVILFVHLLKEGKASIVIPFTSLYPAVSVLIAIYVLGEKLNTFNLFGIIFALIAVIFLSIK